MTDTPDQPEAADADSAPDASSSYAVSSAPVSPAAVSRAPEPPDATSPDGAASDGAASDGPVAGQRRRRWLAVAAATVAVVLVAAAVSLGGARLLGWWPVAEEPAAQPSPPAPTEPPSPFEGTPAEGFAEGADGIVLPEAEAVGEFTAEEVAEALEQVRRALIAARLDPTMLVDHNPDPFLALLAPDQQTTVRSSFEAGTFGRFATQVATSTLLAPWSPRVEAVLSYRESTAGAQDTPILEVLSRAVWVYALEDAAVGKAELVVVRDELVWEVRSGAPWLESSEGLWLPAADFAVWGADCGDREDGFLRPAGDDGASVAGEPTSVFDPLEPLDGDSDC